MYRFVIIKDIFWTPIWKIFGFIWLIFGHALNLLSLFEVDVEDARGVIMSNPYTGFIIDNWWLLTVIIFALAIAEGIYIKAHLYLGDKVVTKKVNLLPNDMKTDKIHHAWIEVENNEHFDLEDCYADLKVAKVERKGTWQPLQALNPSLSKLTWSEFNKGEVVTVRRENSERVDIAKVESDAIFFIFQSGEIGIDAENHFYLEITVNGKTNSRPIKELTFEGFLRYKIDFVGFEEDGYPSVDFENYQRLYLEPGEIESD